MDKPSWLDSVQDFEVQVQERSRPHPSGPSLLTRVKKASFQSWIPCSTCEGGGISIEPSLTRAIARRQTNFEDEWAACGGHVGDRPCIKAFKVTGTISYA